MRNINSLMLKVVLLLAIPAFGAMPEVASAAKSAFALILFASDHTDPGYVAAHIASIESKPFDGIVINEYLGRNLFNAEIAKVSPAVVDSAGVITYEASSRGLRAVKGIFRRFRYNFAKVNFDMVGFPPLLLDETGWQIVNRSAQNYAHAVQDAGLKGIFFDNEVYRRPGVSWRADGADYWDYNDQIRLLGRSGSAMSLDAAVALARRRGREFMRALTAGSPTVTVIVAHGPYMGCDAWRGVSGGSGSNRYLLGAFAAGMVEGATGGATFVDGGEDYDLRQPSEFLASYAWRKGTAPGDSGITQLGKKGCPFMDADLAREWSKVQIAFSTFDKERTSRRSNDWLPITDIQKFQGTLTNALRAADGYVWYYCQWQNWLDAENESKLLPWIEAIRDARRDAGMTPGT